VAFGSILESVLLAAFFLVPFSHLWGQLPPAPPETVASPAVGSWQAPLAVAAVFGLPSLVPFLLLWRLPRGAALGGASPAVAIGSVVLILLPAAVALVTYPCCTSDVLDYINRQRLWVVYGGNPFAVVPSDHPDDWSYYFANFKDSVFGYGPVWWLLARLATQWATTLDEYLVGFKLLAAICFGVSAALVWRLADERMRLASLAFFVWNPAVLVDGLLRLHNDLLTVPFVLGAVWLWHRGRLSSALIAAALGTLAKVTVAPLGLVMAASLVKTARWRALALGVIGTVCVLASLYAPFWYGPGTFAALFVQANRAQWSLGSLLVALVGAWLGPTTTPVVRGFLTLAFVVLMGLVLTRMHASGPIVDASLVLTLIWLVCLPLAFYSHYLIPAVGLAAVAVDGRLRTLVLAIGFAATVNAVLGVQTFAGGLSGSALDVVGSCIVILGVVAGSVAAARGTSARPARAT
jgi:hypothetical protein